MALAEALGLREQKKARTREAISAAAYRAFVERGFDRVTVDEIATAARISRRTFFRYFETKEAVVFQRHHERVEAFRQSLSQRYDGEAPYDFVRRALRKLGREYMASRNEVLMQHRIVESSSTLMGLEMALDREWEAALTDALLAGRTGDPVLNRQARVLAGATFGVLRVVLREWFGKGGKPDLVRLGDAALDQLELGVPEPFLQPLEGPRPSRLGRRSSA